MLIGPGVEVKAVEGNPLRADGDFRKKGADFRVESIPVHAEIGGRIS